MSGLPPVATELRTSRIGGFVPEAEVVNRLRQSRQQVMEVGPASALDVTAAPHHCATRDAKTGRACLRLAFENRLDKIHRMMVCDDTFVQAATSWAFAHPTSV